MTKNISLHNVKRRLSKGKKYNKKYSIFKKAIFYYCQCTSNIIRRSYIILRLSNILLNSMMSVPSIQENHTKILFNALLMGKCFKNAHSVNGSERLIRFLQNF